MLSSTILLGAAICGAAADCAGIAALVAEHRARRAGVAPVAPGPLRRPHQALRRRLGPRLRPFLWGVVAGLTPVTAVLAAFAVAGWAGNVSPSLAIASPADHGGVGRRFDVRGTSSHLDSGRSVWVLVRPHVASQLHPQPGPALVGPGGAWSTVAYVGTAGSPPAQGEEFDVLAVVTTRAGDAALADYLRRSAARGSYPGLDALPPGADLAAEITVSYSKG